MDPVEHWTFNTIVGGLVFAALARLTERPCRALHQFLGKPIRWWYGSASLQIVIACLVVGCVGFAVLTVKREMPPQLRLLAWFGLLVLLFVNVTYRVRTVGRQIRAALA